MNSLSYISELTEEQLSQNHTLDTVVSVELPLTTLINYLKAPILMIGKSGSHSKLIYTRGTITESGS